VRNPFRRSADVPAEVVARAGVARGDRVRAGQQAGDGTWLLGTAAVLLVVPPEQPATAIPWERVETADWDREGGRLRVVEVGEFGTVKPVHVFNVEEPGALLPMIRERVTASVVLQRRVVVSGKKGFLVLARRSPTGAGDIGWAYQFDPGVDPDDPEVRRLAEAGLRAAAEELGL
jgi:hypothetical protein